MLSDYLIRFNSALEQFQEKFPRPNWSDVFKINLVNDYSFYSARIEDEKLQSLILKFKSYAKQGN